ncbi:glycosyl transferase family 2 [Anaeromyxobacter dehalogenans 2CP-1]|uniref:Glycosyl transferase family 2 n=1 Tax=Anaeromyxobacter dehalogenans (strain ATCC BAA-258 / DSM 21875 / 2CP-1) TaxID=455488 RepID=B8JFC7_ANAD2|nr:glycosyltransferase family 2 protein [Anaeromyxobacter dehalogenans]ACL66304.1 glycosyl transferase family 2 [Anaeromyxobacter dehalogenans 2CP-1]
MKLLVAILNFRTTDLTIDCLRSLEPEVAATAGFRVAVLENGSGQPDAYPRLQRAVSEHGWGDWAEVTASPSNLGFTGGNNLLIRRALASDDPPEYVLLLNSDTRVEPRALGALVEHMERTPAAGIGGSTLLSAEGAVQASPFRFGSLAAELDRGLRLGAVSRLLSRWAVVMRTPAAACAVDWVSGASMILRRTMLDEIGLLDEGLFTYFDDLDLCLRARRAGWETWFVPESRVIHLEGASSGISDRMRRRPAYWFQARRRFLLKNYGRTYAALADAAFISGFAVWRLRRRLQGKPDLDPPHMLADAYRHSVFGAGFALNEVRRP